jgi:hypothetical protein
LSTVRIVDAPTLRCSKTRAISKVKKEQLVLHRDFKKKRKGLYHISRSRKIDLFEGSADVERSPNHYPTRSRMRVKTLPDHLRTLLVKPQNKASTLRSKKAVHIPSGQRYTEETGCPKQKMQNRVK